MNGVGDQPISKSLQDLRILLIQLRKDPDALPAERKGFVTLSGLEGRQFDVLDVYRETVFPSNIIDRYDAIMIGGLSDDPSDSVEVNSEIFPFLKSFHALLQSMIGSGKPGLLSCGGFMLASVILGGRIALDPSKSELGIVSIQLSEAGKLDPLFQDMPQSFMAVTGHIKSTISLPPDSELLAWSDKCPVHAFRINSAPIYAFQFHPEITCADLESRVSRYKHKYFKSKQEYLDFLTLADDTSAANHIVRRFIELITTHDARRTTHE